MDLNYFFNRFLKLSKKILNEKDHDFISTFARQLQDDIAYHLAQMSKESCHLVDNKKCVCDDINNFISTTKRVENNGKE